jgi:hypothetical protein
LNISDGSVTLSCMADAPQPITPFVVVDGEPDEPGDRTFKVTRIGEAWSLALHAPHGMFPIAGVDPSLRSLLERIDDGAELPFICRMLPGRPRNILNTVAVRLATNLKVLERVVNQLPEELVHTHRDLVIARFWARIKLSDETGALADFNYLLGSNGSNCDSFWSSLSPTSRAETAPALMVWLESRVYGFEDGCDPDVEPGRLPNGLNPNRLYKLPVELWPQRALAHALDRARHTKSLSFFPNLTFDVLRAETARRAAAKTSGSWE